MLDPSYALQQAVYATLSQSNGLTSLIGTVRVGSENLPKIFHRVPADTPLPFVNIGQDTVYGRDESGDFSECEITVHVFAATMPQAKQITAKVTEALKTLSSLDGFTIHETHLGTVRHMTDPDGMTAHSVVEFEYLVQPATA